MLQREIGTINIDGSNDAFHIHEIDHTAKSLASADGLRFNNDGYLTPALNPATGTLDEISAYQAQYAFDPNSLMKHAKNISSVNFEWVAKLNKLDGTTAYPAIFRAWSNYQKSVRDYKKKHKQ